MTHLLRRFVTAVLGTALLTLGAGGAATADTGPVLSGLAISCVSPQRYIGSALTPCTATASPDGGLSTVTVPVVYENNVQVGTATASASLPGGAAYPGSSVSASFEITRGTASAEITCPVSVPYTGSPVTPCSARVVTGTTATRVDVRYTNNTGPGIAFASPDTRLFTDPNYILIGQQAQFTIGATTTTEVTCTAATYTGSPITNTCTATTTGAGDFTATPTLTFSNNTNAGTATVTATYAGDGAGGNLASSDTTTFAIAKADVSLGVTCGSAVFTGAPLTPCAFSSNGAGTLTGAISATYSNNVNAGQGSVGVSYPGDANHNPANTTGTFTITPAPVVVTVTCPPSVAFTGAPLTPCTATVTGPGLATTATVTYTDNTYAGTATASASYPAGGNYLAGTGTATFRVIGFTLKGYYQPVDMSTADTTVWNTVKAGSTVPLKFEAFLPNGAEITDTTTLGATFTTTRIACTATAVTAVTDDVEQTSTDATGLRYDPTSGQFIQNWKTSKGATGCYRVTTTTADHSTLSASFILR